MKKILIFIIIFNIFLIHLPNVDALTKIEYSYQYKDYNSKIEKMSYDNQYICCEFIENDKEVYLKIDKGMRYVVVNEKYYDFNDYNNATFIQAQKLHDENINLNITDILEKYQQIDNLDIFLNKYSIKLIENNNDFMISPQASYGTYYLLGTYSKKDMTIALTAGAIGVILGVVTNGLAFSLTSSAVTSFVSSVLTSWGLNQCIADVYYKKWQAVLNVHGTTRERRQMGAREDSTKAIQWDKDKSGNAKYYYRTFETQRPVS